MRRSMSIILRSEVVVLLVVICGLIGSAPVIEEDELDEAGVLANENKNHNSFSMVHEALLHGKQRSERDAKVSTTEKNSDELGGYLQPYTEPTTEGILDSVVDFFKGLAGINRPSSTTSKTTTEMEEIKRNSDDLLIRKPPRRSALKQFPMNGEKRRRSLPWRKRSDSSTEFTTANHDSANEGNNATIASSAVKDVPNKEAIKALEQAAEKAFSAMEKVMDEDLKQREKANSSS